MNVKTTRTIAKVITLSLITSTMIHATNGDTLIAVGAKSRGMGGVGVAMSHGAESTLNNPALITSVEGTEISFGGTVFMPTIKTGFDTAPLTGSDADMNLIPSVSVAHKINENWSIGIGLWGTAGLGVDYSKTGANFGMVTNLQLMQFAVPIAYKTGGLSIGIAPVLQYGNLDINYAGALAIGGALPDTPPTGELALAAGAGLAQDFGWGYNAGLVYDLSEDGIDGLTLGASYKSSIEMNYNGQLSGATQPFADNGVFPGALSDALEQPAEIGVGFAYDMGEHAIAFDYKQIKWSDTKGYGDFQWEDSKVYAFGYQYTQDGYALRAGYNYASSAVVEVPGGDTMPSSAALNFFNLLGFPATAERHYTVGGSYEVTKAFSVDLAYVRLVTTKETFDISAFKGYSPWNPGSITTSHAEDSISFQLAYKF